MPPRPSYELQQRLEPRGRTKPGGFTVKESSGRVNPPGAMTSIAGKEETIEDPTTVDIMKYRRSHADDLQQPGAYLGGYQEEGDPKAYLDVSRRFVGPGAVDRAVEFGRGQGQVSVWEQYTAEQREKAGKEGDIHYVHTSPNVEPGQEYPYSSAMAQATREQIAAREAAANSEEQRARINSMVDRLVEADQYKFTSRGRE